ncbi:glycoside hydrolase family 31 protein [Fulvivirga sp.]|uniref:glycoside hydrolase family 31 protein n=1 Tax=Fulvivirga sp. TaxID=1931237 RepID=UPI0032ED760D
MDNTKNNKLSQDLGAFESFKIKADGLHSKTSNGNFIVKVYDAGIVRVHIYFGETTDTNKYSVIANPVEDKFSIEDTESVILVKTSLLKLEISKSPVRFTFKKPGGQIISADDTFGSSRIGDQITTYKKLQEGERFIGLGEKTGPLDRRGQGYEHWNTDSFAYGSEQDPLYCSTPFYIGLHNNLAYGIYLDNSHKSFVNFGASNDRFSSFSVDAGDMDYYFIHDNNVEGIIKKYAHLTGTTPLPPLWSIGYQQCRYSYYPDVEVERIAKTFRQKNIPADVIVLDIHYMEQYKIFTWDNKKFSKPAELVQHLKELGFHVVVMCDPGIKIEDGYTAYESGKQNDVFIKYPDGTNYSGTVWPGLCHFPDFTKASTRDWWEENLKSYTEIGVDGFWNDMNEIATWGQMLPELIEFDFDGEKDTARKGRNIYGFQMSRATFEGTKAGLENKRPFNLTRAGFSGIQRYAAVWTGDNVASDEHMMLGVRLVNSMGLAGIAFAGYDVGGFVGNASEHLFARWAQIGSFSPFFRGHSMINSRDSEPWAYGEQVEEISTNFIRLRYKLMPYIYSLFFEASVSGMPLQRSLAINYSFDHNVYSGLYQNQYLFGPSIMVAPLESDKTLTKVYLPEGEWYEMFNDQKFEGNQEMIIECGIEKLPVFIKSSSIIPVVPQANTNTQGLGDTLEIHVYAGHQENSFVYYEDDGESYDYENGQYHKRTIVYNPENNSITLEEIEGSTKSRYKHLKFCLHAFDDNSFTLQGQHAAAHKHEYRFIEPISNFDPFGNETGEGLKIKEIKSIETEYVNDVIILKW